MYELTVATSTVLPRVSIGYCRYKVAVQASLGSRLLALSECIPTHINPDMPLTHVAMYELAVDRRLPLSNVP